MKTKILFLLKRNLIYGSYSSVIAKSGLLNSAKITSTQLTKHLHVHTDLEVCVDGNEIDKFLHQHKPRVCILEAIWVMPEKLKELTRLHKKVLFIVLIHSEVPFLAQEGNAIKWIREYDAIQNVYPAFNSKETFQEFKALGISCFYLPNIYFDVHKGKDCVEHSGNIINLGCFGAIRPFKNQLIQAMAALLFAENRGYILHFHMNTSRIEQSGEAVLKNIKALFEGTQHSLVEHGWGQMEDFFALIRKMDLGLQISFTESFNLVAANFVQQHVPVIVSETINWMPEDAQADVESMGDILLKMNEAFKNRAKAANRNTKYLTKYNEMATKAWKEFLKNI